jgi:hypothetical protein
MHIVLATGPDLEGEVEIGVWVGADLVEEPVGGVVFDGSCSPRARGYWLAARSSVSCTASRCQSDGTWCASTPTPSNPTRFNV